MCLKNTKKHLLSQFGWRLTYGICPAAYAACGVALVPDYLFAWSATRLVWPRFWQLGHRHSFAIDTAGQVRSPVSSATRQFDPQCEKRTVVSHLLCAQPKNHSPKPALPTGAHSKERRSTPILPCLGYLVLRTAAPLRTLRILGDHAIGMLPA